MKRAGRTGIGLAVVAAVLLSSGAATSAATISMSDWAASPVRNVGELTFTLTGYTVGDSVTADFWDYGGVFGQGITFAAFPTDGYVEYEVAINNSVAPGSWIDEIYLTYDLGVGGDSVTKYIAEQDVTLSSGGDNYFDVPDGVSSLTITDTFSGVVNSASNQYITTIPEPATMGLLALGGVALIRRRRTV